MRIAVVAFGLVALISTAVAAQVPARQHTFVPAHKSRLSIDFGMTQAVKRLPQRPAECDTVKKRHHELLPRSARIAELPIYGGRHHLNAVPATPCPAR